MSGRAILHVDMDAFFAAVEEREDPTLRGKPVVVGADPKGGRGRGVVSTANYEARRYGIHSAMPISEAWRRCPHAVYVKPHGRLYRDTSHRIFRIFRRYTDLVEGLSVDEAFLDVTASRRLFGPPREIATALKEEIRGSEQLTASVGVAPSKFVAKVASDLEKPDGLVVVDPGTEADFLASLPVSRLWGAGPKAQAALRGLGCATIGEVAALDRAVLVRRFGEVTGDHFHRLAHGIDHRPVRPGQERKSLGKETTFDEDVADRRSVERTLLGLTEEVAASLRRKGLAGTTVTVKLRFEGFETHTRQRTLGAPLDTTEEIWPIARELLRAADRPGRKVRLVGVTLSGFEADAEPGQIALFEPATHRTHRTHRKAAEAVDRLRERFGRDAVTRAALLERSTGGPATTKGIEGPALSSAETERATPKKQEGGGR